MKKRKYVMKTSRLMSVQADQDRVSLPDKIFVQAEQGHVNDSTINKND